MMTCRELTDFLLDYLDGGLPEMTRAEFERHLALCPNCVHYLHNYEQVIRAAKLACEEEPEAALPDDLVQAIVATARTS